MSEALWLNVDCLVKELAARNIAVKYDVEATLVCVRADGNVGHLLG